MDIYNENQRSQKLLALKHLDKQHKAMKSSTYSSLDDYLTMSELMDKYNFNKTVRDCVESEWHNNVDKSENANIEAIINKETDLILPFKKEDLKVKGSLANAVYSYFKGGAGEEDSYAGYVVLKMGARDNLDDHGVGMPSITVNFVGGFNIDDYKTPRRSKKKRAARVSSEDKVKIKEMFDNGVTDSKKINEELGNKYRVKQIKGIMQAYER